MLNPEPKASDDPEQAKLNVEAAERSVVWNLGWFADPVYFGDYVRARLFLSLPSFRPSDTARSLPGSVHDYSDHFFVTIFPPRAAQRRSLFRYTRTANNCAQRMASLESDS